MSCVLSKLTVIAHDPKRPVGEEWPRYEAYPALLVLGLCLLKFFDDALLDLVRVPQAADYFHKCLNIVSYF